MLAMFDVLGFSRWMKSVGLSAVLDSYHLLIENVVIRTNEKGGLSAIQTPDGALFALTGPPGYAYFSDTILIWHPLVPALTKETLREYATSIVLDWPRRWRDKHGECPSSRLRELNTDPQFSLYWENTIAFAEFSLTKHDWHLRPDEVSPNALLRLVSRKDAKL